MQHTWESVYELAVVWLNEAGGLVGTIRGGPQNVPAAVITPKEKQTTVECQRRNSTHSSGSTTIRDRVTTKGWNSLEQKEKPVADASRGSHTCLLLASPWVPAQLLILGCRPI